MCDGTTLTGGQGGRQLPPAEGRRINVSGHVFPVPRLSRRARDPAPGAHVFSAMQNVGSRVRVLGGPRSFVERVTCLACERRAASSALRTSRHPPAARQRASS
eukprot:scaffold7746_cov350-Prasinococcus_capsulatus_cf.AAC.2